MNLTPILTQFQKNQDTYLRDIDQTPGAEIGQISFAKNQLSGLFEFIDRLIRGTAQSGDRANKRDLRLLNLKAKSTADVLHKITGDSNKNLEGVTASVDKLANATLSIGNKTVSKKKTAGDLTVCFPDKPYKFDPHLGSESGFFAFSSSGFYTCTATNIEAIEVLDKHGNSSFRVYNYKLDNREDYFKAEYTLFGSGQATGGSCEFPKALRNKPLKEQLKDIGFVEIGEGIFELTSYKDYKGSAIFVFEGPNRGALLQRVGSDKTLFKKGTKLVTVEHYKSPYSWSNPEMMCIFENRDVSFALDENGYTVPGSVNFAYIPSLDDLGIKPVEQCKQSNGFVIGGVNDSSLITKLDSINGVEIQKLERTMRPENLSKSGFLGNDEKLLDVMVKDNDYVLGQNLTHQEIATPLKYAMTITNRNFGPAFVYNDERYKVDCVGYMGPQFSPFKDGTATSCNYIVTRLNDGKSIDFSGLLPAMIEKYGFYEGHGMPPIQTNHYSEMHGRTFRLEPKDVVELFKLA